jgi:hypothetical protein
MYGLIADAAVVNVVGRNSFFLIGCIDLIDFVRTRRNTKNSQGHRCCGERVEKCFTFLESFAQSLAPADFELLDNMQKALHMLISSAFQLCKLPSGVLLWLRLQRT